MEKRAGIYIHIPFCERKCTYCNFNTTDFADTLAARYIAAVAREIAFWGGRIPESVDTIYFGGGTPSIVEATEIARLIEACRESFDVAPATEITIEINPATLSRRKLDEWRAAGINRASVGVQSFLDSDLAALSRTHTARQARDTIDALAGAGFDNISLDLIAGLPEQSLADWEFNLDQALGLRPAHLSLYLLEIKEGTQLYAQLKRGQRPRPDDDLAAEMYRVVCASARDAGYEHYEISNFALRDDASPGRLRSKHNMKYWTGASFYGMGCGAHSYDGVTRRVNLLQTEKYIEAVNSNGHATGERTELTHESRATEALFMGLRLIDGIRLDDYYQEYGLDVAARYESEIARLEEAGLVEISGNNMKLTARGLLLSNEVFVCFV
ncbi:MAG TPA: radical SAM family heme chaperone HemW [Blastocatellia bacterium]|nr:radical SAM family heme chaperone HemW [Blastocatellia bacterium]